MLGTVDELGVSGSKVIQTKAEGTRDESLPGAVVKVLGRWGSGGFGRFGGGGGIYWIGEGVVLWASGLCLGGLGWGYGFRQQRVNLSLIRLSPMYSSTHLQDLPDMHIISHVTDTLRINEINVTFVV